MVKSCSSIRSPDSFQRRVTFREDESEEPKLGKVSLSAPWVVGSCPNFQIFPVGYTDLPFLSTRRTVAWASSSRKSVPGSSIAFLLKGLRKWHSPYELWYLEKWSLQKVICTGESCCPRLTQIY